MLDLDRYEALTFDCYGTLIDWESGILRALESLLGGVAVPNEALLEMFGRFEPEAEAGPFRSYRAVLTDVAARFRQEFDLPSDDALERDFAASVAEWPPFDDSPAALQALASKYRLGIVSNVDDDLFAGSAARLGVDFDEVVTAAQVRSYKPERAHFDEMLERLALPRDKVLHVAQSLYHDIGPASALGYSCVWVNRRQGRSGAGATRPAQAVPDLEVGSLGELAGLAGLA